MLPRGKAPNLGAAHGSHHRTSNRLPSPLSTHPTASRSPLLHQTMPVTTKTEAEALTVAELKTELESRGLPTEGLKASLLESLLSHMDSANGDAAPANGTEEPKSDEKAVEPAAAEAADAPEAVAEPTAEAPDAPEAPAADAEAAPVDGEPAPETTTRTAEEVTGGTEQPDAKKAKTSEPEAAPEEPKTAPAEVAVEAAPSAEPTATA